MSRSRLVLPHHFPFRFISRFVESETVRIQVSADDHASRGLTWPRVLAIEVLAQAAISVVGEDGSADVALAGVDDARFEGELEPGAEVTAELQIEGRFGGLTKLHGRLIDAHDTLIARADLMVVGGNRAELR